MTSPSPSRRSPPDADLRFLRRLLAAIAAGALLMLGWHHPAPQPAPAYAGVVVR